MALAARDRPSGRLRAAAFSRRTHAAHAPARLVARRYDKGSIIITTNQLVTE
jgi:hypothetical protein